MAEEVITPEIFKDNGYLQEINRLILHPAGLELRVADAAIYGIRMASMDKAMLARVVVGDFTVEAPSDIVDAKARSVSDAIRSRRAERIAQYGWITQPAGVVGPPVWIDISTDELIDLVYDIVIERAPTNDEHAVLIEPFVEMIGAFFAEMCVSAEKDGCLRPRRRADDPPTRDHLTRARYIAEQLPYFLEPQRMGQGDNALLVPVQLLPDEIAEARELHQKIVVEGEDITKAIADRLEDLFALAQPGMRFWRKGKEAAEARRAVAQAVREKVNAWASSLDEVTQFLSGQVSIDQIKDKAAVITALKARLEPINTAIDAVTAERATWIAQRGPLEAALQRLSGND